MPRVGSLASRTTLALVALVMACVVATPVIAGGGGPSPAPNTILPGAPAGAPNAITSGPASAEAAGVEILSSGFGQAKPGAPVTVAARIRNDGPPVDLVPVSITVYDGNGVVIAAADVTAHYLAAGETTGFAHRLSVHGSGAAAQVQLQPGDGRPAGDPLPGGFSFSDVSLVTARSGYAASAVLTSAYGSDASEVRVDAVAYDASGAIIGGGETIKRLVPAGTSVGVLVPLDLTGAVSLVELYAHLP